MEEDPCFFSSSCSDGAVAEDRPMDAVEALRTQIELTRQTKATTTQLGRLVKDLETVQTRTGPAPFAGQTFGGRGGGIVGECGYDEGRKALGLLNTVSMEAKQSSRSRRVSDTGLEASGSTPESAPSSTSETQTADEESSSDCSSNASAFDSEVFNAEAWHIRLFDMVARLKTKTEWDVMAGMHKQYTKNFEIGDGDLELFKLMEVRHATEKSTFHNAGVLLEKDIERVHMELMGTLSTFKNKLEHARDKVEAFRKKKRKKNKVFSFADMKHYTPKRRFRTQDSEDEEEKLSEPASRTSISHSQQPQAFDLLRAISEQQEEIGALQARSEMAAKVLQVHRAALMHVKAIVEHGSQAAEPPPDVQDMLGKIVSSLGSAESQDKGPQAQSAVARPGRRGSLVMTVAEDSEAAKRELAEEIGRLEREIDRMKELVCKVQESRRVGVGFSQSAPLAAKLASKGRRRSIGTSGPNNPNAASDDRRGPGQRDSQFASNSNIGVANGSHDLIDSEEKSPVALEQRLKQVEAERVKAAAGLAAMEDERHVFLASVDRAEGLRRRNRRLMDERHRRLGLAGTLACTDVRSSVRMAGDESQRGVSQSPERDVTTPLETEVAASSEVDALVAGGEPASIGSVAQPDMNASQDQRPGVGTNGRGTVAKSTSSVGVGGSGVGSRTASFESRFERTPAEGSAPAPFAATSPASSFSPARSRTRTEEEALQEWSHLSMQLHTVLGTTAPSSLEEGDEILGKLQQHMLAEVAALQHVAVGSPKVFAVVAGVSPAPAGQLMRTTSGATGTSATIDVAKSPPSGNADVAPNPPRDSDVTPAIGTSRSSRSVRGADVVVPADVAQYLPSGTAGVVPHPPGGSDVTLALGASRSPRSGSRGSVAQLDAEVPGRTSTVICSEARSPLPMEAVGAATGETAAAGLDASSKGLASSLQAFAKPSGGGSLARPPSGTRASSSAVVPSRLGSKDPRQISKDPSPPNQALSELLRLQDENQELEEQISMMCGVSSGQVSVGNAVMPQRRASSVSSGAADAEALLRLEEEIADARKTVRSARLDLGKKRQQWMDMDTWTQQLKQKGLGGAQAASAMMHGQTKAEGQLTDVLGRRNSKLGQDIMALRAAAAMVGAAKQRAADLAMPAPAPQARRMSQDLTSQLRGRRLRGSILDPSWRFVEVLDRVQGRDGRNSKISEGSAASAGLHLGLSGTRYSASGAGEVSRRRRSGGHLAHGPLKTSAHRKNATERVGALCVGGTRAGPAASSTPRHALAKHPQRAGTQARHAGGAPTPSQLCIVAVDNSGLRDKARGGAASRSQMDRARLKSMSPSPSQSKESSNAFTSEGILSTKHLLSPRRLAAQHS